MRRLAPWLLVGVLGIGVAAGAALGESQRPGAGPSFTVLSGPAAASWVKGVLATTSAAGSAHFTYVSVTSSPDSSSRNSDSGSGVVDFAHGDFQVTQVNHQVAYEVVGGKAPHQTLDTWSEETIGIGKSVYQNLAAPVSDWGKYSEQRDPHRALGLDQASAAENALAALSGLVPVASVRDLGPGTASGLHATRYRVTDQTLDYCEAHEPKISITLVAPTTVWVDGQGRIVQAAVSQRGDASIARLFTALGLGAPAGTPPASTTTFLHFSDFGAAVHIAAPALGPNHSGVVARIGIKGERKPSNPALKLCHS